MSDQFLMKQREVVSKVDILAITLASKRQFEGKFGYCISCNFMDIFAEPFWVCWVLELTSQKNPYKIGDLPV